MGQNSASRVRLHDGTRWRGRSLPYVRPYCKKGPKPLLAPAGSRFTGLNGLNQEGPGPELEGAQNALKWPKISQNGSGQPLGRVQSGYPGLPPDKCQLPIDNRRLPLTANRQPTRAANQQPTTATNRQPPSTANGQPCQTGPKNSPK